MMLRIIVLGLALLPNAVRAGGPRMYVATASVVTLPNGYVAVPFAVPVAMPSYVQYQAVDYGYVGAMTGLSQSATAATAQSSVAAAGTNEASSTANQLVQRALSNKPLVASQCGKCHGAVQPKAGLNLTAVLDDAMRLKAIARLLADDPQKRMPQGKDLPAEVLGSLIQELATSPQAPAPTPALSTE